MKIGTSPPRPAMSHHGYVLPVVVLSMTAMLLLLIGLLTMVGLERGTSLAWKNRHQAELAAESALAESKLVIGTVAGNDYYQIIRSDLPSPSSSSDDTPYYYAVEPSADASGDLTYSYHPLFSASQAPAATPSIQTPDDLLLPDENSEIATDNTHPWQPSKQLVWKLIKNPAGETIARYAWWAEDLQGYLNPAIAGNQLAASGQHERNDHLDPTPGINPDQDEPALDRIALYTMQKDGPEADSGAGWHKDLIDARQYLFTDGSLLPAAGAAAPVTRNGDGQLQDEDLRTVEQNLSIASFPYNERPVIPYTSAVSASERGKPRLNLNAMLSGPRNTAIDTIASLIDAAYPSFANTRKGGFPEDYTRTLAANMLDYADEDSDTSQSDGAYRGIESAPLVSEFLLRYTWTSIVSENGRKYVGLTGELYMEIWNPTNQPVHGSMEVNYDTHYSFPLGAVPSVELGSSTLLDDPNTQHNLVKKYGGYYFPPIVFNKGQSNGSSSDELAPNEYRVLKIGSVQYKIDAGPSSTWIPSPLNLANDDGLSDYKLYWNGSLYDWARGKIDRNSMTLYYPSNTSSKPRSKVRCTIPGHSYGQYGGFVNNMGDPRMSYYITTVQGANSYPRNYSPNRRNIRLGIYRGGYNKIYGRVLPSEWPDSGHDAPFGGDSFYTTDQRIAPDDNRFVGSPPAIAEDMAPTRISNRGLFYSVTELGNVYDPVMWDQKAGDRDPTPWQNIGTNATADSRFGGGNTLRIGRIEHPRFDYLHVRASGLVDLFHCGQPRSDDNSEREGETIRIDGHVNVNTASRDVLRALIAGQLQMDPRLSELTGGGHDSSTMAPPIRDLEISAPSRDQQADIIADALIHSRPFASLGEVAQASNESGVRVFGNRALYARGDAIQWSDPAAEELYARLYNSTTVRSRNFRVFVVAQAIGKDGKAAATVRKSYNIFANPGERNPDGSIDPAKLTISTTHETLR